MRAVLGARLAAGLACLALGGCAGIPTDVAEPVPVPQRGREVADLLAQAEQLAPQPVEEKKRELLEALTAFERDPADGAHRLRLILALTQPRVPWHDEARLLTLLAEWPPGGKEALMRQVAQLVVRLSAERQHLLKEDQRRYETLRDEHRRTDIALRETQKKIEELQHKLDALRAIDRDARRRARR